jgi:hypothetical protein
MTGCTNKKGGQEYGRKDKGIEGMKKMDESNAL